MEFLMVSFKRLFLKIIYKLKYNNKIITLVSVQWKEFIFILYKIILQAVDMVWMNAEETIYYVRKLMNTIFIWSNLPVISIRMFQYIPNYELGLSNISLTEDS